MVRWTWTMAEQALTQELVATAEEVAGEYGAAFVLVDGGEVLVASGGEADAFYRDLPMLAVVEVV